MNSRILKRLGRECFSIVVCMIILYTLDLPLAVSTKIVLTVLGKILREQGMSNIPF